MNNKGMSFVFISFLMFAVFVLLATIWQIGINDITLSKSINRDSKSYYVTEAGIYYAGSIIYEAVKLNKTEPPETVTVEDPFSEYSNSHGFSLTITKEGNKVYRVRSDGYYTDKEHTIETLVKLEGTNISYYDEFRKIS